MEYQLWKAVVALAASLRKDARNPRARYDDVRVVAVFYWAVLHDRPIAWAVRRRHWPIHLRKEPLPSNSLMSRRLRSPSVVALLDELENRVIRCATTDGIFWMVDGKPLTISGVSKDKQAGYGRAARGKARGYKIHMIVGPEGVVDWRLTPMNTDERTMAARMLKSHPIQGYLIADKNFDSNPLHELCDELGELQLITPRRFGKGKGLGHHRHSASRLRSIERTENPFSEFARELFRQRGAIERRFANLTNWGGGLTNLPPWVRTYKRVRRWVQAKLVLQGLKASLETSTCAA